MSAKNRRLGSHDSPNARNMVLHVDLLSLVRNEPFGQGAWWYGAWWYGA